MEIIATAIKMVIKTKEVTQNFILFRIDVFLCVVSGALSSSEEEVVANA